MKKAIFVFCLFGLFLFIPNVFSPRGTIKSNRISWSASLDMEQLRGLEVHVLPSVLQIGDKRAKIFVDGVLLDGSRVSLREKITGTTYTVSGGVENAVSLDENGLIVPLAPGVAEITIRNGEYSEITTIEVLGLDLSSNSQKVSNWQGVSYKLQMSRHFPGFFTINTIGSDGIVRSGVMLKELFTCSHVGRLRVPLLSSGVVEVSSIGSYSMSILNLLLLNLLPMFDQFFISLPIIPEFGTVMLMAKQNIYVYPNMRFLRSIRIENDDPNPYENKRPFTIGVFTTNGPPLQLKVRGVFWFGLTRDIQNSFFGTIYTLPLKDKDIIKVSKDGVITALRSGKTTLTIRNGRQATTLPIEVREP